MRRIRKAKMAQRVGQQKVSKIIGAGGNWHRAAGQQCQPQRDRKQANDEHRPARAFGKSAGPRLNLAICDKQGQKQRDCDNLDPIAESEAQHAIGREKYARVKGRGQATGRAGSTT